MSNSKELAPVIDGNEWAPQAMCAIKLANMAENNIVPCHMTQPVAEAIDAATVSIEENESGRSRIRTLQCGVTGCSQTVKFKEFPIYDEHHVSVLPIDMYSRSRAAVECEQSTPVRSWVPTRALSTAQ